MSWSSIIKTAFSTPAEVHAFVIGFYHGLLPHRGIPRRVRVGNSDVQKEIHYAKGGYIAGEASKYGVFLAAGALSGDILCGQFLHLVI